MKPGSTTLIMYAFRLIGNNARFAPILTTLSTMYSLFLTNMSINHVAKKENILECFFLEIVQIYQKLLKIFQLVKLFISRALISPAI